MPLSLDSPDPRYAAYFDEIRRTITEKWSYPCVREEAKTTCEYKAASLEVHFGILKDGRVQFVEVVQKSGYAIYDEYAVKAINLAFSIPTSSTRGDGLGWRAKHRGQYRSAFQIRG